MQDSAADGGTATRKYEDFKRGFLDTAEQCRANGFLFIPIVIEAHSGALGLAARKVIREMGRLSAQLCCSDPLVEAQRNFQGISMIVQRENARAILRRACSGVPAASSAAPAAVAAAAAWAESCI